MAPGGALRFACLQVGGNNLLVHTQNEPFCNLAQELAPPRSLFAFGLGTCRTWPRA
jgi:hypothetical protein